MRRGFQPRRPYRPGRGAPRGRFIAQSSSRNLHATIELSDSDYDYESSGDIKVVNVKHSTNTKPLLLSDSEEDESNSDSIPYTNVHKQTKQKEVDWNSRKTPPEIHKKRIEKEDHLRGQSKPFDLTNLSYSSSSYSIEGEPNPNIIQKNNDIKSYDIKTPTRNTTTIKKSKQQTKERQDAIKSDNLLDVNHDKNIIYSEPQNTNNTDQNNIKNRNNDNVDTKDTNLDNNPPPIENTNSQVESITPLPDPIQNIDSNPFQSFIVVRKGKKFSKVSFELHENNTAILKSLSKKEGKKSIQLIYKEEMLGENISSLPSYLGYLRSRKKKHSYTFYTTAKKSNRDDREGELLCVCFNDSDNQENTNDSNKSSITVVIPKYGTPNYPISQRVTLENFADTNSIDESKYIKLVGTEITADVESQFGSSFYTKSGKNCALIEPKSNKYVLIFLKSNYEIFNLKVRPPLTFLHGFALAIALIKHDQ